MIIVNTFPIVNVDPKFKFSLFHRITNRFMPRIR